MEGKGLACWVLYDQNSPVYLLPMNKHDNITLKCCFLKKVFTKAFSKIRYTYMYKYRFVRKKFQSQAKYWTNS